MSIGAVLTNDKKQGVGSFVFVFLVLMILIVGLTIGIIIFNVRNSRDADEVSIDAAQEDLAVAYWADSVTTDIIVKLEAGEGYTLDEARLDFEKLLDENEGREKYYLTVQFAYFIYFYYGDIGWSVNVLNGVDELVGDSLRMDYYLSYRNLYEMAEDESQARYYDDLIKEVMEKNATK